MKLIYTEQSLESLEEALKFIAHKVSYEKLIEIRDSILDAAESLKDNPFVGQKEPYLEHLKLEHRRIIKDNYKIIYRLTEQHIYITDIFDTRQNPVKMKS
ncbi:MAG: type II toxin-antitoxin system RelE/ParE family toxin [Bacteroidales bacterium]|nr:type II toxin-antitoxin system RelE/ParE family toxin [Bacteroidales bacterium]